LRIIINLREVFYDLVPRCVANVLEDNNRRLVFVYPLQHASERPAGLAVGINILLLVVQIGVIDARRPGDEQLRA
jgi:hypothetical protein